MYTEPRLRLETYAPTGAEYTLLLPATLDTGTPVPLVVALHFGGYSAPHYGRLIAEQLVAPAYETLDAIVVAPDCPDGAWKDQRCERTVLGLIDDLQTSFPINPRRIVLTGYSMGGIGTWDLSARHQNLFSAAIVMAGHPHEALAEVNWELPLYVIHARQDELMPVAATEQFVQTIRARGARAELTVLDGVTHFETHRFVEPLRASLPWLLDIWAGTE